MTSIHSNFKILIAVMISQIVLFSHYIICKENNKNNNLPEKKEAKNQTKVKINDKSYNYWAYIKNDKFIIKYFPPKNKDKVYIEAHRNSWERHILSVSNEVINKNKTIPFGSTEHTHCSGATNDIFGMESAASDVSSFIRFLRIYSRSSPKLLKQFNKFKETLKKKKRKPLPYCGSFEYLTVIDREEAKKANYDYIAAQKIRFQKYFGIIKKSHLVFYYKDKKLNLKEFIIKMKQTFEYRLRHNFSDDKMLKTICQELKLVKNKETNKTNLIYVDIMVIFENKKVKLYEWLKRKVKN